jgi:SAM-dependent methyltransferase
VSSSTEGHARDTRQNRPVSNADAEVLEREAEFWRSGDTPFYRVRPHIDRAIGAFARSNDMHAFYDARDQHVLDYGCGSGRASMRYLRDGAAFVTGFDIAPAMIEAAEQRAVGHGVAERTAFLVADAHRTPFDDDAFDLVVGIAILHHLDIPVALREIRRVLRPGGRAVFMEPLWHNPILRLGRRLTPMARVEFEHPLRETDWAECAAVFPDFEHHERELVTVPLMPLNLLLPRSVQERLAPSVNRFDDRVRERYPSLRKYARITILVLK